MSWLGDVVVPEGAAQVFATLLAAVVLARLCRYLLRMFGLA